VTTPVLHAEGNTLSSATSPSHAGSPLTPRPPGPGPGSSPVGKTGVILAAATLCATTLLVLYLMFKVWPHPTPSGQPESTPVINARRAVDSALTSQASATQDTAIPSKRAVSSTNAREENYSQDSGGLHDEGSNAAAMKGAVRAPVGRINGISRQLSCDHTITTSPYLSGADSLWDPDCVSIFTYEFPIWLEQRLLLIVLLAGALGGLLHCVRSVGWYVGNRDLRRSWLLYYAMLPLAGALMAFIFYVVVRGGLFSPSASFKDTSPFGIAAIAVLVGMFSQAAALKLQQVAETLFTHPAQGSESRPQVDLRNPSLGEGTLNVSPTGANSPLSITDIKPSSLHVGSNDLTVVVTGIGIQPTTQVTIDDALTKPSAVDPDSGTLTVTLPADKIRSVGALALRLINPPPRGGTSDPQIIQIS
jgi:hypothetical protein